MSAAAVEAVHPRIDTLVILAKLGFVILRKLHVLHPSMNRGLAGSKGLGFHLVKGTGKHAV